MVISTNAKELGQETFGGQFYKGTLTHVAYSAVLRQAVAAGPAGIKVSRERARPLSLGGMNTARAITEEPPRSHAPLELMTDSKYPLRWSYALVLEARR